IVLPMVLVILPSLVLLNERASNAGDKPVGLDKRVPWTTSRVRGSPEPPYPYRTERLFANLRFEHAVDMAYYPLGKRWFVCEQFGLIHPFVDDAAVKKEKVFLALRKKGPPRTLWSMTSHPRFQTTGQVFVCYYASVPPPARSRFSPSQADTKKAPPV